MADTPDRTGAEDELCLFCSQAMRPAEPRTTYYGVEVHLKCFQRESGTAPSDDHEG